MAVPAATAKVRKVLVKSITGPIRATLGDKLAFEVLECRVDDKRSDGNDLTAEEAKQIKWVLKEATSKPYGSSHRLEIGRELATGIGKTFEYTVLTGMVDKAVVAMAYVNTPSKSIAQWVKISTSDAFTPSSTVHSALTTTFPEIIDKEKLDPGFRAQWDAFQVALEAAGAEVTITATQRSRERAYMMHYCGLIANGTIKPWEVPDGVIVLNERTDHIGMEWSHRQPDGRVDEAKSKRAANQMKALFEIAYPASLTSNHVRGKAIDVYIEWDGTLKIKEKGGNDKDGKPTEGKEHEIKTTPRHGGASGEPAGNKELREVAKTYGIHKMLTDAPHWSTDGK